MSQVLALMAAVMGRNGLVTAFVVVGLTVWVSYQLSARLTRGQLHGSAIAIMLGLLAGVSGRVGHGRHAGRRRSGNLCRDRTHGRRDASGLLDHRHGLRGETRESWPGRE